MTATQQVLTLAVDYDHDAPNPNDDGSWRLISFNRRHNNYEDPDKFFEFKDGELVPRTIGLRRKLDVGTAFLLSYYEHGLCRWSLRHEGPQCRWDTNNCAGLLLWEQPAKELGTKVYQDRAQYARGVLETYTNWCNGQVYCFALDNDGPAICGFYDVESLKEAILDELHPGDRVKIVGEAANLLDDLSPAIIVKD